MKLISKPNSRKSHKVARLAVTLSILLIALFPVLKHILQIKSTKVYRKALKKNFLSLSERIVGKVSATLHYCCNKTDHAC